jgi:hypothetical protein
MMQYAPPSPTEFIPIFGIMGTVFMTGMLLLGPVGRAIGDVIRNRLGGGAKHAALSNEQLDELHARFDALQQQLGEIAERQDFAERLLAQSRAAGALGPPKDTV